MIINEATKFPAYLWFVRRTLIFSSPTRVFPILALFPLTQVPNLGRLQIPPPLLVLTVARR